jgi:hypothetical protein
MILAAMYVREDAAVAMRQAADPPVQRELYHLAGALCLRCTGILYTLYVSRYGGEPMSTEPSAEVRRRAIGIRRALRWQPIVAALALAIWTVTTAMVGAYWSYHKFQTSRADTERISAAARKLEAQKPFLEKRLSLYMEAIEAAGSLTDPGLDPTKSDVWDKNAKRFWQLRWSHLEMFGDAGIRNAARVVGEQINEVQNNPTVDRHRLRWSVECLADELRLSLEHTWGLQTELERLTALKGAASKIPHGCSQEKVAPVRPWEVFPG